MEQPQTVPAPSSRIKAVEQKPAQSVPEKLDEVSGIDSGLSFNGLSLQQLTDNRNAPSRRLTIILTTHVSRPQFYAPLRHRC